MLDWPAGIELFAVLSVATLIIILPTNIKVDILLTARSSTGSESHVHLSQRQCLSAITAISNPGAAFVLGHSFWSDCPCHAAELVTYLLLRVMRLRGVWHLQQAHQPSPISIR